MTGLEAIERTVQALSFLSGFDYNNNKIAQPCTPFMEDVEAIKKDLAILEKIKESIWKSDDAYYIDMCVTANNENKDIYNWLKEQEEAKFYNSISHTDHTEDGQDIIICDKVDKECCGRCKHKEK